MFFFLILVAVRLFHSATVNMYANTVAHKVFKKHLSIILQTEKLTYSNTNTHTHSICINTPTAMTLPVAGYIYKHKMY